MIPLIDGDILRCEIGSGETYYLKDKVTKKPYGDLIIKDFRSTCDSFDRKVEEICALVWATEEPIIFLSMDARTKRRQNKRTEKQLKRLEKKFEGVKGDADKEREVSFDMLSVVQGMEYKPNFREGVAEKREYKGNRKDTAKPECYDRLTDYILAKYECVMAEGLEADDLLSIYQRKAEPDTTIICSRDKDLRITPGMHFGWECGKQSQFGPEMVTELGRLRCIYRGKLASGAPKLLEVKGTGLLFFCLQLIKGDTTDNIPGIPKKGWKCVKETLMGVDSYEEALCRVRDLYIAHFGIENWEKEMLEQARLLWMVAELDEDGKPVMFELPDFLYVEDW
jgi:5'-3' exonuclease